MKFDILNHFTGAVQVTAEIECNADASTSVKLGLAVKWAFKSRANLSGADLSGADLSGADLRGADLSGADLSRAYLSRADLRRADLSGANLSGADLRGAYLSGADLSGANLSRADLSGAYLNRAYLSRAYLSRANLSGADLSRADLSGANLSGDEWIVQGATRSDGYTFLLTHLAKEGLRIKAGCRDFTIDQANVHWKNTRAGTKLYDETNEIINGMFLLAWHRGIVDDAWQPVKPAERAALSGAGIMVASALSAYLNGVTPWT